MESDPPIGVTLQDVAARAGVSTMTVSRVVNQAKRVAPATRERVERAIHDLGFVPNALARGLLQGRTHTIALLLTDISNPFFTQIARGVEDVAQRNGYTVIFANSDESPQKEAQYVQTLLSHQIDGLIIAPAGNASRPLLDLLIRRKKPFVLIDRVIDGIAVDAVVGDNIGGARILTEHLIALGHRRIALVHASSEISTARERQRGYLEALWFHGIEVDQDLIVEGDFKRASGAEAARQLLRLPQARRPTAIFADNNFHAIGVIESLREAKQHVPQDIAVVCFDDIELASALQPFLTVVAQPARTFGTIAMQFLLDRLTGTEAVAARRVVLPPELIIRESCGAQLKAQKR
ncbi:MAG: LacI family DNA-binding transcriptional regulator [Roseiflexaceae bacterium]|nr:LacI family DNA-binding transcriptional regulator [Roseiflexaceae bacterium]